MQKIKKTAFCAYWRNATGQMRQVRSLAGAGLLAALSIVLKMVVIPLTQVLRISFAFLGMALGGYLYGPVIAGFIGLVADTLGFLLGPQTGPYMPAFGLVAFIGGFIYGCWLYRRPVRLWRAFCAHATHTLVVSFMLNPVLLWWMYGKAFWPLVAARLPLNAVMLPLGSLLIYLLQNALARSKVVPGLQ